MYQDFDEFADPTEKQDRKYINRLAYYLHNQLIYIPQLPKISIRFAWIQYIGVLREQNTTIVSTKAMNLDVRYHALAKLFIAYDPAQTHRPDLNAEYRFSKDLGHHVCCKVIFTLLTYYFSLPLLCYPSLLVQDSSLS